MKLFYVTVNHGRGYGQRKDRIFRYYVIAGNEGDAVAKLREAAHLRDGHRLEKVEDCPLDDAAAHCISFGSYLKD